MVRNNHLLSGTVLELTGYTLSSGNGALSGEAYADLLALFVSARSSRVHSDLCASTGSHLPRLSELRWSPTTLVRSLCYVGHILQQSAWTWQVHEPVGRSQINHRTGQEGHGLADLAKNRTQSVHRVLRETQVPS